MLETPFATTLAAFIIGFFVVLAFFISLPQKERRFLLPLAIGSYLIKSVLIPLYFMFLLFTTGKGFAFFDASNAHFDGIKMTEEISLNLPHNSVGWRAADPGFYVLTAYTYLLFGPNTLVIRYFLIACTALSLIYVYRIAIRYGDETTARISAVMQAFVPAPILFALNHNKDPIVQLLTLFIFYHSVRVFRQERSWQMSAVLVPLGLVAVFPFRSGLVLPFIAVMFICFLLSNRNILQGIGLGLVTLMTMVLVLTFAGAGSKFSLDQQQERAEGKFAESAVRADYGGMVRLLRVQGPADIWKTPIAAFAYLIMPFPPKYSKYQPANLGATLHMVGVLLLPHMLLGVWILIRAPDWRQNLPVLVFPIVFLVLLGTLHLGLTRYREIFYPVCLIWAAIGWQRGTSVALKLLTYGGLVILSIPVYLSRMGIFG